MEQPKERKVKKVMSLVQASSLLTLSKYQKMCLCCSNRQMFPQNYQLNQQIDVLTLFPVFAVNNKETRKTTLACLRC